MRCGDCGVGNGRHADQCPRWNTTEAARVSLGRDAVEEAEALMQVVERHTRMNWGFAGLGFLVGVFVGGGLVWLLM